jgi:hypothetical protein
MGRSEGDIVIPPPPESPPSTSDPEARGAALRAWLRSAPRRRPGSRPRRAGPHAAARAAQVWDVIVVGAGIAGASLAFRLGNVRTLAAPSRGHPAAPRARAAPRAARLTRARARGAAWRRRAAACCSWSGT